MVSCAVCKFIANCFACGAHGAFVFVVVFMMVLGGGLLGVDHYIHCLLYGAPFLTFHSVCGRFSVFSSSFWAVLGVVPRLSTSET